MEETVIPTVIKINVSEWLIISQSIHINIKLLILKTNKVLTNICW